MPASRLKVALVCTAPLDSPGSMQAYAQTLEHALGQFAHDIDARVLRIGPRSNEGVWSRRTQTLLLFARAWKLRPFAPEVWHVLDGSRAYIGSALRGAPIVITVHDLIPWLQGQGRFPGAPPTGMAAHALWRWNGAAMRSAAALACDSISTETDARDCFLVRSERSQVIPLPLRPSLAELAADASPVTREAAHVLHVGNNGFYKARQQVLRIFARLDAAHARKLTMIGPPPTSELSALASSLGIEARVDWVGDPGDAVLAEFYRRASVLLFPSLYEGFGWPVLEAMAFGLPVVCSNRGSLPEVAGDACPCFDPDDIDAFVGATTKLLADTFCAASAAEAGRRRAATFTEERLAKAMRDVYLRASDAGRVG